MSVVVDKDLSSLFGQARDQDPRPTCMAFAASDAHAAARGARQPLSVEWAYYHALRHDHSVPHAGVTMSAMLHAIRIEGQPAEAAWPYMPELFTDITVWVPPNANPIFRRESTHLVATVEAILACLDANQPALFTMSISKSFRTPSLEGVVDAVEPIEPQRVHALVAVGYGHRHKEQFLRVRNSWGEAWGSQGYAWLAMPYVRPRLLRVATMAGEL